MFPACQAPLPPRAPFFYFFRSWFFDPYRVVGALESLFNVSAVPALQMGRRVPSCCGFCAHCRATTVARIYELRDAMEVVHVVVAAVSSTGSV